MKLPTLVFFFRHRHGQVSAVARLSHVHTGLLHESDVHVGVVPHLHVVGLQDQVLVFPHDGHPGVDVDGDRDVALQAEAGALDHALDIPLARKHYGSLRAQQRRVNSEMGSVQRIILTCSTMSTLRELNRKNITFINIISSHKSAIYLQLV